MLDRIPRTVASHFTSASDRFVVVFTDQYDATQEISFFRPVKYGLYNRGIGLLIIAHNDLRRMFFNRQKRSFASRLNDYLTEIKIEAIVMSRYTGEYWDDIIKFAQNRSVRTSVFLDDDLLEVPEVIGADAARLYAHPDRREALLSSVAEVDCVVGSTKTLAEHLKKYPHRSIKYTPIYCSVRAKEISLNRPNRRYPVVGYMASRWHRHDLDIISEAIDAILRAYPLLTFCVFGFDWSDSEVYKKYPGRVQCIKPVSASYMSFRQTFTALAWDIGIAPLSPIQYNRFKANTKWIEYACAGAAVVAADMPPYADIPETCVTRCESRNIEEWVDAIDDLLLNQDHQNELRANAYNLLRHEYSIDSHAKQLLDVFFP
jgi:glycosyltransferase involved in cell wall biosynthesis